MPHYFFDTEDGDGTVTDGSGVDLPDDAEARKHGLSLLPDIARQKIPDGDVRTLSVIVRDEAEAAIYIASLRLTGRWTARRG